MIVSEQPRIRMFNADCMGAMQGMEDNAYDLAIVDPPYGIGASSMNLGFSNSSRIDKSDWDNDKPDRSYFAQLERVSEHQVVWGGNYFDLWPHRGFIIWDKMEGMYGRSFAECELAYVSFDKNSRVFRLAPNNLADKKIHKSQKPVPLYKWLLTNYATEGDRILDTHGGSGSIAIACWEMGFDLDWYEIDTDYYEDAVKRFKEHTMQGRLFKPEPKNLEQRQTSFLRETN